MDQEPKEPFLIFLVGYLARSIRDTCAPMFDTSEVLDFVRYLSTRD